jgi:hypothetical protein
MSLHIADLVKTKNDLKKNTVCERILRFSRLHRTVYKN